ncbi:hypothetical protein G8A07_25195 [Roseateles sp. DAIF2]|uniref:hypothetical protein n=1 Tax=Roseateles sp. DAIF2 TaxID=2714952 RepID=UPI0018A2679C|nr:hypothetical protein [Roseateles sp. DAIF2]QPF75884.1 hypothetical protein G8A07_25195 [Roseateles sp. DAIF2]
MKLLLLLSALAMPLMAWLARQGLFGPDPAQLSDRFPTLLVAAGYAFSIWAPIFLLDLLLALHPFGRQRRAGEGWRQARPALVAGFALCAAWMALFPMQRFGLALLSCGAAWACVFYAALRLARSGEEESWLLRAGVGLHAGWLSLALLMNSAQWIVARQLLNTERMLPWSLLLWGAGALLLMLANRALRGHWAFVLALLWGLLGVQVKQSASALPGADLSAGIALLLAGLLLLQSLWLWWRDRRGRRARRGGEITLVNLR